MAGLLTELRRQIAKNRRSNENMTGAKPKSASPVRTTSLQRPLETKSKTKPIDKLPQGNKPMYETNSNEQMNEDFKSRPYGVSPYAVEEDSTYVENGYVPNTRAGFDYYADTAESYEGVNVGVGVTPVNVAPVDVAPVDVNVNVAPIFEDRTNKPVVSDDKDDVLLLQIDEFRERAKQLQEMMNQRESQAKELKSLVDERQEQADSLEIIVKERQEQTEKVAAEVEKQLDVLIAKVGAKMDQIERSMKQSLDQVVKGDMEENRRVNREQAMEMKASLEQIQSHLLAVKDELPLMKEELTNAKGELSEKVHTENVKCYRNLQDLFKTIDAKIDHLDIVTDKIKRVKTSVTVAILLGLINLVAMAGLYLLQLGIISF